MTFTDKIAVYKMQHDIDAGWDNLGDDYRADVFAIWLGCEAPALQDALSDNIDTTLPVLEHLVSKALDNALSDLELDMGLV